MTKQRCADVLRKQQEKAKAKAEAESHKDKTHNTDRLKSHKSKGKAFHPDQIKRSKKDRRMARTHDISALNDPHSDKDTQDEDILIWDNDMVSDDGKEPIGPDTPSLLKDKVIHLILWAQMMINY